MPDYEFTRLSFLATIAFGVLALLLLAGAGMMFADPVLTGLGLIAAGLSYLAQLGYTFAEQLQQPWARRALQGAIAAQVLACLLFVAGVWHLFGLA